MQTILAVTDPEFWIVNLGAWLTGWFEPAWRPWIQALLQAAALVGGFATLFAVTTILERKGLGRIQNRPGPNRVGPFGLLQPAADGIKMLTKEDIVPARADKIVHFLAPIVMLAPVTLAFAVIPYGREMTPMPLDAGLLFFFAVGAGSELAAFMAGWSSRNKYSLLGAIRAIAQMISFELPLVLSTVAVVMMAGSLSLVEIARRQAEYVSFVPQWHILTPWGLAGFLTFFTAALAESNRSPFDLPEGESEIIGGFMTEYSGFKYAIFFMAEYFGMFAVSSLAVVLFLGAWSAPLPGLQFIPSYVWFGIKLMGLLFVFIWLRGTLPRLRADQLMSFCWKLLLPMALINIGVAAGWHYSRDWSFPAAWGCRWFLGLAGVGLPFMGLAWGLRRRRGWGPRVYRYAE
ncbi:MAG TPA: NADH-quinone oxidoreductase subunit NuoH [Candidatus Paceibacterota bacterium]|nr:NADH-quinone oxidoreductase subunit NuoH [Verrucomicrobiota bacterium]HRY48753.1 NADH-quinone oxidoreductase subunit NuoH [Candidatus Paceibacterota bacterium]HSA00001.1 NADH-quinone oxidoreductase subunit NuoH [Candidatus Paceibacterota bacterium]